MKISLSENDRHNAFRIAVWNIAKFHKIEACDYKTTEELYDEIVEINSPLIPALNNYLEASTKWFNFYEPKKKSELSCGIELNLNNNEKNEFDTLMSERQNTLDTLQKQFDQLRNSYYAKE